MATPSMQTIAIAAKVSVTPGIAGNNTRLKLEFLPIMLRLQKDELAKLIQILTAYQAKMALEPI